MPNILLVNCPPAIGVEFRSNADYRVTEVVRWPRLAADIPEGFAEPRKFDIVIDDSANVGADETPPQADGVVAVNSLYLDALAHSRAIVVVPHSGRTMSDLEQRLFYAQRLSRQPYLVPEMRPANERAAYFRSFVYEFEPHLEATVFQDPTGVSRRDLPPVRDWIRIYKDEDNNPRIFSYEPPGEQCKVLVIPNITPDSEKARGCKFLVDHVLPFLVPDSYVDILVPSTVRGLKDEWLAEQIRFREKIVELERQITDEEDFYRPFKPVVRLLSTPLHELVGRIFEEVWGMTVTNLDAEADRAGEPRKADLLLVLGEWRALVEVTGGGRRAATTPEVLEPFLGHIEEHERQLGPVDAKIIVFNPHAARPLPERLELPSCTDDFPEDAKDAGVTFMTTFDLFHTLELKREGSLDTETLIGCLTLTGRIALPGSP